LRSYKTVPEALHNATDVFNQMEQHVFMLCKHKPIGDCSEEAKRTSVL